MSLTRHDGKNSGSLAKIWIKLKSEITDTHTPPSGDSAGLTISRNISLTGNWLPVELISGEASWQESQSENDQGNLVSFSIQFTIDKDRKDITEALRPFIGREIMVIAEDQNDAVRRLLGEAGVYEYHSKLSYNQVKEKKPGRNAYDLTIECQMHHPACYYEGAIPE